MKKNTSNAKRDALIPAVGYIRMSTDDQKDSPERQRGEIVAMAQREGYSIIRWYEDLGISGTDSKNRPGVLRMMADVANREFKAILVYEPSRFSRDTVLETAKHWSTLVDHEVVLHSVTKGIAKFDDVASLVTQVIEQHQARQESVTLAHRALSGRRAKAEAGKHCGPVPFGYDREIFDESGRFVRRVAFSERFKRPSNWTAKLVPSLEEGVVDAVRFMFQEVINGRSTRYIAAALNKKGCLTRFQKYWSTGEIRRIISNPVYIGILRFGAQKRGKFASADHVIMVPDTHAGLVSVQTYNEANALLASVHNVRGGTTPGRYPLSRIMVCEHCGGLLTGATTSGVVGGEKFRMYRCVAKKPGVETCDVRPTIAASHIEHMILRLVAKHVLSDANFPILREREEHMLARNETIQLAEHAQLEELRHRISRAEGNLALADSPEDFKAVSKSLTAMREAESKLIARIRNASRARPDAPRMLSTVEDLKRYRENLFRVKPVLLMQALRATIRRITFGRTTVVGDDPKKKGVKIPVKHCFGSVEFSPEIYSGPPIRFCNDELFGRRYVEVAEYVTQAGRQVRASEIAEALEMEHTTALYHAKMAARNGLLVTSKRGCAFCFEPCQSDRASAG